MSRINNNLNKQIYANAHGEGFRLFRAIIGCGNSNLHKETHVYCGTSFSICGGTISCEMNNLHRETYANYRDEGFSLRGDTIGYGNTKLYMET